MGMFGYYDLDQCKLNKALPQENLMLNRRQIGSTRRLCKRTVLDIPKWRPLLQQSRAKQPPLSTPEKAAVLSRAMGIDYTTSSQTPLVTPHHGNTSNQHRAKEG